MRRPETAEWNEEQLRYQVLRAVYDKGGARCERTVTGTTIGADLDLRYEDLFRVIHFLEFNGFLNYLGAGPRVCITQKGIHYVDEAAGRRKSLRSATMD
jgi:hypothetical protein